MKRFMSALCATALTAAIAVTGVMPANAAPAYMPKSVSTTENSDVVKVQDFRWKNRNGNRVRENLRRSNRHWDGRRWDGPRRNWDGRRYGWYNGHRGYRDKRRGYRYHNGYWFPAAAFITGAIVGGAIANSNNGPYYRGGGGSAHVEWCYDRYRSYRASDNTFQPYNGPRRQCYSPYG